MQALLRQLPSVDRLLQSEPGQALLARFGHDLTLQALRQALATRRAQILAGSAASPDDEGLLREAAEELEALVAPSLRPVINATGVIVHTNLGRAPLSAAAQAAVTAIGAGYSTLEYDLASGERGSRAVHAERLLTRLTGAEAALVVNNTAAALLLSLTALCRGREVIISRGQLIEIGGGFRVPEVMVQSGARLVEVGTTNRTHLGDYESAIGENTAAILVAHHSNFKVIGFTAEPDLAELAEICHARQLPLIFDQGSGALLDTGRFGLDHEPTVAEGIAAGCDLVTFSGDKLLGGPQAGILVGRADLVAQARRHPLARAVRADKLCLAALSATLTHYLSDEAVREVPVWRMVAQPVESLRARADDWAARLSAAGLDAEVLPGAATVGGGSLPGETLAGFVVAIAHAAPSAYAARLRRQEPPVIARIQAERLLFDPRTVLPGQDESLMAALIAAA